MSTAALPELEYPLLYVFRVVARKVPDVARRVRQVLEPVVGPLPDDAVTERDSRAGHYAAVHVTCLLASEDQRREAYARLKAEPFVMMML